MRTSLQSFLPNTFPRPTSYLMDERSTGMEGKLSLKEDELEWLSKAKYLDLTFRCYFSSSPRSPLVSWPSDALPTPPFVVLNTPASSLPA